MEKILAWAQGLPKWVLVTAVVVIMAALPITMFAFIFGGGKQEDANPSGSDSVVLSVQGASNDDVDKSNMRRFSEHNVTSGVDATKDWWDQLAVSQQEDNGSSDTSGGASSGPIGDGPLSAAQAAAQTPSDVFLDPNEYSELEIYNIRQGFQTKEQVDAIHARRRAEQAREEAERRERAKARMSPEQRDSAYFARMQRLVGQMNGQQSSDGEQQAAQAAAAVPTGTGSGTGTTHQNQEDLPVGIVRDEEGNRHIDFSSNQVSMAAGGMSDSDDIFSSLDAGARAGMEVERDGVVIRPVRVTFVKDERVVNGQRVFLRLLEDLYLNNGTVIRENTHVSGIVNVSGRMQISIRNVPISGRILSANLSAFDLDGTEGIYCPVTQTNEAQRAGKQVASETASNIGSAITTVFSRSNVLGNVAGSGIRSLSSVALSDGTQAVDVFSGYEFYLFENVKKQ